MGRHDVDALAAERGLPPTAIPEEYGDEQLKSWLASPLSADRAIRIALVNGPKLKAAYISLGVAAAEVYAAGRIHNPVFSFASLDSNASGEGNMTAFGFIASFTDLLTLPARKRLAEGEFAAVKQSVGAEVLDLAMEAEAAFYQLVTAKQVAALRSQMAKASSLSLEMAKRYYMAGNLSPRDFASKHAMASELQLASLEAEAEVHEKRAQLASLLGISSADVWSVPAKLPLPLEHEEDLGRLLALAGESRLDLAAARTRAEVLAGQLGLVRWTRWLGELDVGVEHERETDGARLTGPVLEWEVPIFTQNLDLPLRAGAAVQAAVSEVKRLNLEIENDVRLAYLAAQNLKARVDAYRERLIPARAEIVERTQEEEAFMLTGVFDLLETKQDEYAAYQGYVETVRDYWLARTELARAVGNTLPGSVQTREEGPFIDVEDYLSPKLDAAPHHHDHHDMKQNTESETGNDVHHHH